MIKDVETYLSFPFHSFSVFVGFVKDEGQFYAYLVLVNEVSLA